MSPIAWSSLARLPAELRQRWAAGRVFAARQAPYLASALLALEPVVVEGAGQPTADIGSFPVDPAWHIYVDPSDLAGTDVPTLGFWLVHQVSHLLRRHADRYPGPVQETVGTPNFRRSLEQVRWNMATDAEINDDVSAGEVVAPPDVWRPGNIGCTEGLVAEEYWDALDGLDFELWQVVASEATDAGRAGKEAGKSAGRGDCGSGCDGRPRPWDCGRKGLGEAARKLLAREVAQRIKEHSRAGETRPLAGSAGRTRSWNPASAGNVSCLPRCAGEWPM